MFETPEIRTSFVGAIVEWIRVSYAIVDAHQLSFISTELESLPDSELYRAGEEIEAFESASKDTLAQIGRQIQAIEHAFDEKEERSQAQLLFIS